MVIFQALKKGQNIPQVETGCTLDRTFHHGSEIYRFTIGGVAGKNNGNKLPPWKLAWHWIPIVTGKYIFIQMVVHFNCYVSFQGGLCSYKNGADLNMLNYGYFAPAIG